MTPGARVVLLIGDTHHNRAAIEVAGGPLRAEYPCGQRRALSALATGHDPGADALIVLEPPRGKSPSE